MRRTSVDTYNKIRGSSLLSKRRMQIYEILYHLGPLTYNEIFGHLDGRIEINSANVGARVHELVELGCVYAEGERKCTVTEMTVTVWDVTENLPVPPDKKKVLKDKIDLCEKRLAKLYQKLESL